ncbi:MAG: GIY-YIG nuclease family protein [Candidatus Uhrbacteria bacterium]|nr:GIY-YIG nuclease family protein [Candidatus Uhrbacteria bacterium]
MRYFIYVLLSESHGSRYVGSSADVEKRLLEHNTGRCRYTSGRLPWKLVYHEVYGSRAEAMIRERFLKSSQGRKFLDVRIPPCSGIV